MLSITLKSATKLFLGFEYFNANYFSDLNPPVLSVEKLCVPLPPKCIYPRQRNIAIREMVQQSHMIKWPYKGNTAKTPKQSLYPTIRQPHTFISWHHIRHIEMASEDFLILLSVVFKKFGLIANEFLSAICLMVFHKNMNKMCGNPK